MTTGASPERRRPGRPLAVDSAETETMIIDAAREAFVEFGYAKCSFSEVARRAGLTRPAVNHYFPAKQDLYDAVLESTQDTVIGAAAKNAQRHEVFSDRLGAFLETAAQVDSANRSYARFITSSLLDSFRHPDLRERAGAQLGTVRSFIRQALDVAVVNGEVHSELDVPAATEMLVAMVWGMGLYAGFVGTHEQLESVIEQFEKLLRGLTLA